MTRRPDGRPPKTDRDAAAIETCSAILALTDPETGRPPTRKALAAHLGLSSIATIVERLVVLRRRGLVTYTEGDLRSLSVTLAGRDMAARPAPAPAGTVAMLAAERWE